MAKHEVIVINNAPSPSPSLFGLLLMAGFILVFWKWVLLIIGITAALFLAYWLVRCVRADMREQERANEAIRARADAQHQQVMRGDPEGMYGWPLRSDPLYRLSVGEQRRLAREMEAIRRGKEQRS